MLTILLIANIYRYLITLMMFELAYAHLTISLGGYQHMRIDIKYSIHQGLNT